jgi:hypothetical protein
MFVEDPPLFLILKRMQCKFINNLYVGVLGLCYMAATLYLRVGCLVCNTVLYPVCS